MEGNYLYIFIGHVEKGPIGKLDLDNYIEKATDGFKPGKLRALLEDLRNHQNFRFKQFIAGFEQEISKNFHTILLFFKSVGKINFNDNLSAQQYFQIIYFPNLQESAKELRETNMSWSHYMFYANREERVLFILNEAKNLVSSKIEKNELVALKPGCDNNKKAICSCDLSPKVEKQPKPVPAVIFESVLIENLIDPLAEFFPGQKEELRLALQGHDLTERITFHGKTRTLTEVFRRVIYNGYTQNSILEIAEWLSRNFQYIHKKGDSQKMLAIKLGTVKEYLSKSKGDITQRKNRICNIDILVYKSHKTLMTEKRDSKHE